MAGVRAGVMERWRANLGCRPLSHRPARRCLKEELGEKATPSFTRPQPPLYTEKHSLRLADSCHSDQFHVRFWGGDARSSWAVSQLEVEKPGCGQPESPRLGFCTYPSESGPLRLGRWASLVGQQGVPMAQTTLETGVHLFRIE